MNGDAKLAAGAGEQVAYITLRTEPQSVAVGEPGGETLGMSTPGAVVARCDGCGFVEERAGNRGP